MASHTCVLNTGMAVRRPLALTTTSQQTTVCFTNQRRSGGMGLERFERDFRNAYDINAPELAEHWEEIIEEIHESGCPVSRSQVGEGYWVIHRYDDIRE